MEPFTAVVAIVVIGLLVGIEAAVAFALHPVLLRLPAGPAIAARADGARLLGRTMPIVYIGSLVVTVVLSVLLWGRPEAALFGVAAALLVVSVVMSTVLLVPINNRTKAWTAEDHPENWRVQMRRWDRLHVVRVAVIVAAFALVASAATML